MSETIGLIEGAMRADADALRVIGQNIANSEVAAYRRQVAVSRSNFADEMQSATIGQLAQSLDEKIVTDSTPGTLKSTGEPLNLALEGNGFFVLQGPKGEVLTRRGDFRISTDGMLVAASGETVMGQEGAIQVGSATPQIEADGSVRVGSDLIGQLRLANVADANSLQYLGNGLYAAPGDLQQIDPGATLVRQGFLEGSNVEPVGEMVALMETLRHFEGAQRFVRGYDQLMEKAISELGKTE
ncbi:MAG TPA: flagellar hook basal-body protein [Steroidobacteraceae bacterium]|nr:flagellar hook basal-body protein [Steroidobacteraceae bacterium]